jgi:flavin reductase (DIM6/NTAB) family NADH-FMN oxidoreductase RutF
MRKGSFMKAIIAGLCASAAVMTSTSELSADSAVDPKTPKDSIMNGFTEIKPQEIEGNVFKMIGGNWMLITAGTPENFNSMTASWGGMGVWNKPVAFVLVHTKRHTYEFLEREPYYTLSFFDEKYRPALLNVFGKKSGRDGDKAKETGLTGIECVPGGVAYAQAKLIIVCKKGFNVITTKNDPPEGHKLFFGEIVSVWKRK